MDGSTFQEQRGLSRLQTARGIRLWNLNGALDAVHSAVTTGAYTIGYALYLGASTAMIGFISAAPSLGQMLQAFSPLLIERLTQRKLLCLIAAAFSYLMWLPIACIPFFIAESLRPAALVLFIALGGAALALALPAQSSWFTDLVPGSIRGRFVARQQSILAGVALLTSLGAGAYMDLFPTAEQQRGFSSLFLIAVLFGMGSVWVWNRIPEPPRHPAPAGSAKHLLTLPFRHPQFRKLMLLVSGRLFLAQISAPFFTVYMLRTLEISYTQIALFTALQTLANIAVNPLWGYLSDKFGYKPIYLMCAGGLAFYPLWWVFITRDNYLLLVPLAQLWGGVITGGIPIAQFNLMIKTAPATNRTVYIGCYTALSRVAVVLGAPIGGVLATACAALPPLYLLGYAFSDLQYLFLIGFLLRLSWVVPLARVSEEASVPARQVIDQMRSGNPLTTFWHLIRMGRSSDAAVRARAARELGDTGSPLAVDELIGLLNDTDREVRHEAVRSLGRIGDERAVAPLLESIGDPASDIAEEAVEALGAIPSPFSLNILVTMLDDPRPSIRKSAVLALGRIGDRRAQEALKRLLVYEQDHLVVLAATESLSKIGDVSILPRLQQLLRNSRPGIERRTLAHSISYLLRASDAFYRLQQTDSLAQDQMIVRIFKTARRRIAGWERFERPDRRRIEALMEKGLRAYEEEQYEETLGHLCQIVSLTLHGGTPGVDDPARTRPPAYAGAASSGAMRFSHNGAEGLRLACDLLTNLHEESRKRPLLYEEFLLAMVAFQRLEEEVIKG